MTNKKTVPTEINICIEKTVYTHNTHTHKHKKKKLIN